MELETGDIIRVDLSRNADLVTAYLPVPLTEAWRQVLPVYTSLGFDPGDLTAFDNAAHRIAVAGRVSRINDRRLSAYLDCGRGPLGPAADHSQVHVQLSTWLTADGDTTLVTTRFLASARESGASKPPKRCSTNGKLEGIIANGLLLRAAQAEITERDPQR